MPSVYQCAESTQCGDGVCEPSGFCSFPDDACASGRRYGSFAGDGLGGTCVDSSEGSTGTPPPAGSSSGPPLEGSTTGSSGGGETTGSIIPGTTSTTSDSGLDVTTDPSASASASSGSTGGTPRVSDGLVVLYRFDEGGGDVVHDSSPEGDGLDLQIQKSTAMEGKNNTGVTWTTDGLRFHGTDSASRASSTTSVTKVREECQASSELTLEAWVTPYDATDPGPDRIVTYSVDSAQRNFSLLLGRDISGKQAPAWRARVRVSDVDSDALNGNPALRSPIDEGVEGALAHVVFVHREAGAELLYLDGQESVTGTREGDFDSWSSEMVLSVGNELDGNRALDATLHLVAVYCRALDESEVQQNFEAGF